MWYGKGPAIVNQSNNTGLNTPMAYNSYIVPCMYLKIRLIMLMNKSDCLFSLTHCNPHKCVLLFHSVRRSFNCLSNVCNCQSGEKSLSLTMYHYTGGYIGKQLCKSRLKMKDYLESSCATFMSNNLSSSLPSNIVREKRSLLIELFMTIV